MADEKKQRDRPRKSKAGDKASTEIELAVEATEVPEVELPLVEVADLNSAVLGHLTLHYVARDVSLVLDGSTAARVLTAFAKPRLRRMLQDVIDPDRSIMANLWASMDMSTLLAVSWFPGFADEATQRMTVDPPVIRDAT